MNLPFFRFHKCISLVYVIQHLFPLQIECSQLEEIADAINDYFVISYSMQLVLLKLYLVHLKIKYFAKMKVAANTFLAEPTRPKAVIFFLNK